MTTLAGARRAVALAVLLVSVVACGTTGGGAGAAPTFSQDGYTVTCEWNGSAINGQPAPLGNNEAISFCRSRAREAAGTVIVQVPNATVQSVTIGSNGSASVCYGAGGGTCRDVLGPLPR